jgi:hypothetical protein
LAACSRRCFASRASRSSRVFYPASSWHWAGPSLGRPNFCFQRLKTATTFFRSKEGTILEKLKKLSLRNRINRPNQRSSAACSGTLRVRIFVAQGPLTAIASECAAVFARDRIKDDVQRLHDATATHALQRRRHFRIELRCHGASVPKSTRLVRHVSNIGISEARRSGLSLAAAVENRMSPCCKARYVNDPN